MYNLDIALNDVQQAAVEDTEGQVLVLSGAGSGKTRVLTARVAYLIKCCGVSPYNVLAITFTNKAAKEMTGRIERSLDGETGVWASTFHSFCAKILRYHADRLGFNPQYTIYSDVDSERVIKRLCAEKHIEDSKVRDEIIWHIGNAKCFGLSPEVYRKEFAVSNNIDLICDIYKSYTVQLKNSNAMDFDDLLLNTVDLFLTCPDILEKYQERFRYINVDEFQDTNKSQYILIKLLAGKHGNIFVVGDEDQSIYSWRGADINNILNFKKDFKDAKIYKLEQNYRSNAAILTAANNIISNNKERLGKTLWTAISGGSKVEVFNAYGDREEADFVVQKISELIRLSGYQYKDIAILFRINALTRPYEERLNLYGMPFKLFGGFKFYERKEVKDILAYMRIAANPKDSEAILRVINFPKRGIGDSTVSAVMEYCTLCGVDLIDALLEIETNSYISPSNRNKLLQFKEILQKLIGFEGKPSDLVETIITSARIEEYYKQAKDDEAEKFENIVELVTAVKDFERDNPDATYLDFLQSVALISDTDSIQDDNYITLATVHSVKGLEFPVVFIIALEESIFPTARSVAENQLEEERRLMYVAVTRAMQRLFLTSAKSRFRFNQRQYNPRSRFVDEMKGDIVKKQPEQLSRPKQQIADDNVYRIQENFKPNKTVSAPAPKTVSVDFSGFVAGKSVIHKKFGLGQIMETFGEGMDKSALIHFEGVGTKKFLLMIANLELVD